MFYPLGKKSEKRYGGGVGIHPSLVRPTVSKTKTKQTAARLTKLDKLWFVERDAVCSSPGRTNTQGL